MSEFGSFIQGVQPLFFVSDHFHLNPYCSSWIFAYFGYDKNILPYGRFLRQSCSHLFLMIFHQVEPYTDQNHLVFHIFYPTSMETCIFPIVFYHSNRPFCLDTALLSELYSGLTVQAFSAFFFISSRDGLHVILRFSAFVHLFFNGHLLHVLHCQT